LLNISNVSHRLKLVKVLGVVDEVEHEVVLHGDIEGLHSLSLTTSPGDGAVNAILRLHKVLVLALDLVNNVRRVDVGAVSVPVDFLARTAYLLFVVVVEEAGELAVRVTRDFSGSASAEALKPVRSEVLRAGSLGVALEHGATELGSHGRRVRHTNY